MLQQGGAQQHDAGMRHAEASRGETCVEHAAANHLREQHVSEHRRVAEIEGGGEGSRSGGFRCGIPSEMSDCGEGSRSGGGEGSRSGGGEGSRSGGGFRWDATADADWVVSAVFANGYALYLLYWYKSTHADLGEGALLGA
jgi:hypothetical protein